MLVPNPNTRARCTGDDESAPKTRDSTYLLLDLLTTHLYGVEKAVVERRLRQGALGLEHREELRAESRELERHVPHALRAEHRELLRRLAHSQILSRPSSPGCVSRA